MLLIQNLTNAPSQAMTIQLESGQTLVFSIWYSYNQSGWYYSFTYGTYSVSNRRIVNSANMIRQIRNLVPFGLACLLTDAYEPVFINDFVSGRASLYTLNPSDVALVESNLVALQLAENP